jgi:RHS repeat-associated protein
MAVGCIPNGMNDDTVIKYIYRTYGCINGVVTLTQVGNTVELTPNQAIDPGIGITTRTFRNKEGSYIFQVPSAYKGLINGKSMDIQFPVGHVYSDVFTKPFDPSLPVPNCKGKAPNNLEHCIDSSINMATGRLSHAQDLFALNNNRTLALGVTLNYSSDPIAPSRIGTGWSHTYEATLLPGDGYSMIFWENGIPRLYNKTLAADTTYRSPLGDHSLLTRVGTTWTIVEPDGLKRTFDNSGKLSSIEDRYHNTLTFSYSGNTLNSVSDATGRVVTFGYDTATGRLASITDPNLNTHTLVFTGSSLTSVTLPGNKGQWTYSYGTNGLLETKTDPEHNLFRYSYIPDDPDKRLLGTVDPLGKTRTFTYRTLKLDSFGQYIADPSLAGVGKVPDPYIAYLGVQYSSIPRIFEVLEKDNNLWRYSFDAGLMRITDITDPNGRTTSYSYNPDETIKSQTVPFDGPVKLTTFYSYDAFGNVLTQSDPVDSTQTPDVVPPPAVTYTYDYANYNDIKSITDNRGSIPLTTTYDRYSEPDGTGGSLLVTRITAPGETTGTTLTSYLRQNPDGTIADITDASDETTSFTYYPVDTSNHSGLLQSITMPDGVTLTYTAYDKNGNVIEFTLTDANDTDIPVKTTQGYDALNQLTSILKQSTIQLARFPQNLTRFGYDNNSNLNAVTDAENRLTTYKRTYQGQLAEISDARQKLTAFDYGTTSCSSCGNGVDKLTAVRDANQSASGEPGTLYSYDKVGNLESETDPLGKKLRYTYFDSGLLKDKIDATNPAAEKLLVSHRYNTRGQLTDKLYSGNSSVHFSYAANGRLENAANLSGATTTFSYSFTYHANGRLKSITDLTGRSISYDEYTGNGQRKMTTYFPGTPDQRVFTYDYDAGRPAHIYAPAGTFTFTYDERGRRSQLKYPNSTQADYSYDDLDQLTSLNHSITGGTSLVANGYPNHDQLGNIKSRTGTYPATYLYNELYRLTEAGTTQGTEKYDYDDVGNRRTGPGPKDTRYQYDLANRQSVGRLYGHDYDNNGNQTGRTTPNQNKNWIYSWDDENRLIKSEQTKGQEKRTITFRYDPFGRRIEKQLTTVIKGTSKTTTWTYVYDGTDIALEILTKPDTSTEKSFYTHGAGTDEHLALERSGQHYFYHADHLGSITSITDSGKNVVQSYSYDSFGNQGQTTSFRNSCQFTGREYDWETNLYYYRARYYDPQDGRFISKDPIAILGNNYNNKYNITFNQYVDAVKNSYAYTSNNPINFTDPNGLSPIDMQKWAEMTTSVKYYSTKYNDRLNGVLNWAGGLIQGYALGVSPPSDFTRWTLLGLLAKEMVNPKEFDDPFLDKNGQWRYPNGDPVQCKKR